MGTQAEGEIQVVADFALKQCGLFFDSSKAYLIRSRLTDLRDRLDCVDFAQLVSFVQNRPDLLKEFIDALTTNETLFFRDKSPFLALEHKAIPELIDARTGSLNDRRIRIWSAGCSTGQEAYSIAMVLSELISDVADWDIEIIGSDISAAAVQKAERAVYTQWEVNRGMPPGYLQKYFTEEENGWRVRRSIRDFCSFECRNLTKPFETVAPYDVVFCRNMAIYLTDDGRRTLFRQIAKNMSEDGYLFVGSTEQLADLGERFEPQRHCRSAFYRPNLMLTSLA